MKKFLMSIFLLGITFVSSISAMDKVSDNEDCGDATEEKVIFENVNNQPFGVPSEKIIHFFLRLGALATGEGKEQKKQSLTGDEIEEHAYRGALKAQPKWYQPSASAGVTIGCVAIMIGGSLWWIQKKFFTNMDAKKVDKAHELNQEKQLTITNKKIKDNIKKRTKNLDKTDKRVEKVTSAFKQQLHKFQGLLNNVEKANTENVERLVQGINKQQEKSDKHHKQFTQKTTEIDKEIDETHLQESKMLNNAHSQVEQIHVQQQKFTQGFQKIAEQSKQVSEGINSVTLRIDEIEKQQIMQKTSLTNSIKMVEENQISGNLLLEKLGQHLDDKLDTEDIENTKHTLAQCLTILKLDNENQQVQPRNAGMKRGYAQLQFTHNLEYNQLPFGYGSSQFQYKSLETTNK